MPALASRQSLQLKIFPINATAEPGLLGTNKTDCQGELMYIERYFGTLTKCVIFAGGLISSVHINRSTVFCSLYVFLSCNYCN